MGFWASNGSVGAVVGTGNGLLAVASAARESLVAGLVIARGSVNVVTGSMGITVTVSLFGVVKLLSEMTMYRWPSDDVQDGTFIALEFSLYWTYSRDVKCGGSVAVDIRSISLWGVLNRARILSMAECIYMLLSC